jgi:osmotically-inducible protein OsmY
MKKTDNELQRDVMAELKWEPSVDHTDIGVAAVNGVVTLTGYVPSYAEKLAAERAAKRVAGVTAIAQEIKVRYASDAKTADHEIAKRVLDVFSWNSMVPKDGIQVKVENGWVSLTGKVRWHYQSKEAARAASQITGVIGVSNDLKIVNTVSASDVRSRIVDAFKRQAGLDANSVTITLDEGKVTLGGQVRAWHERQAAERAAWAAPGVTEVVDRIALV